MAAGIRGLARRSARAAGLGPACGLGAGCAAFAGLMAVLPSAMPGPAALGAGAAGAGLVAAGWRWVRFRPHRRRAVLGLLEEEVDRHRAALRRNLARAVKVNDYGRVVGDRRLEAVEDFLRSVDFPEGLLGPEAALAAVEARLGLGEGALRPAARGRPGPATAGDPPAPDLLPADPIAFEAWVADRLRARGWDARSPPAGHDQGVDVIARKGGVSVGLQCKLYSGAVGNRAVQEVIAGIGFHGLARGAVLTNAAFTRSAVDLARSTGVVLMTHHDLDDPDRLLMGP